MQNSCVGVSLTLAMAFRTKAVVVANAFHAKAVRAYRAVAKACAPNLCRLIETIAKACMPKLRTVEQTG